MGDYGIRTKAQLDAVHNATRITSPVKLDLDLVYLVSPTTAPPEQLIGAVTLAQRSPDLYPDIGWALHEGFMGKGYATEAAAELLRMLRDELGLRDICTWPDEKNVQSNRVAEKLGFVEGGTVRNRDEGGKEVTIWILPGMEGAGRGEISISFWGEGGVKKNAES
jgi:RimJ/RimL family protein N-acetyltransferase